MKKFEKYTSADAFYWLEYNQSDDSERDYLERIIATDAWHSYKYAKIILKKPFPLGEEAIATDVNYSYWYAEDILRKPFPMGEKAMFSDSYFNKNYIDFLIKTNQMNESTIFDYDNSTKYFLGKFLDGKI